MSEQIDLHIRRHVGSPEAKRILRIIAGAIPEQGPPTREDRISAVEIMRHLYRAGYGIVKRADG